MTVVTGEELRAQQVRNAAEALRSLPGVSVNRGGGFGNLTQVRIRGAEGNHTLVLIDGIEANNTADGEFDFSNLSDRGHRAHRGDPRPHERPLRLQRRGRRHQHHHPPRPGAVGRCRVRTEGGSFGTRDVAVRASGGSDKAHMSLSYHWRDTNGFNISPVGDERDGSRIATFTARGGATLLPGVTARLHRCATPRRPRIATASAGRPARSQPPSTIARRSTTRCSSPAPTCAGTRSAARFVQEFRANHNGTITADSRSFAFPGQQPQHQRDREVRLSRAPIASTCRRSAVTQYAVAAASRRSSSDSRPKAPSPTGCERQRGRVAYTGEWRGGFANRLFLTAGIRRDDNDKFQDFTTWRIAASLVVSELGMRPHASVGTAVKLPSMFEQFGTSPFFVPNPSLTPEQSFGWDARHRVHLLQGQGDPRRHLFPAPT